MIISQETRLILDKFAPYGSGAGSLTWIIYHYLYYDYLLFGPTLTILLPPTLAYLLCTCTHRKFLIYSNASIAGFFGHFLGLLCGMPFAFLILYRVSYNYRFLASIPLAIFSFIIPFYLSWYFCTKEQKKELANSWRADARCRFCDTLLNYSQICPKCGRKNP